MKKYIAMTVLLGAIAVTSVSYLAKAEPKTETVTTTVNTTATTTAPAAPVPAPAVAASQGAVVDFNGTLDASQIDKIAKDTAECTALASAKKDGAAPTPAETDASVAACLKSKGHNVSVPAPAPAAQATEKK